MSFLRKTHQPWIDDQLRNSFRSLLLRNTSQPWNDELPRNALRNSDLRNEPRPSPPGAGTSREGASKMFTGLPIFPSGSGKSTSAAPAATPPHTAPARQPTQQSLPRTTGSTLSPSRQQLTSVPVGRSCVVFGPTSRL